MKTIIRISILFAALALSGIVRAQLSRTNVEADPPAISNTPPADELIRPSIRLEEVPITSAIKSLAWEGGINYIIDPKLTWITGSEKAGIPEPIVTFRLTDITLRDTLNRMLNLRHAVMIEDPFTHVARITSTGQATNVVDVSLLNIETNQPVATNELVIPLIQLQDVPLAAAFDTLIRQTGVTIKIDPRLTDPTDPVYGGILLSLRWENITAKQALVALCLNYDLVIVKDDATGVIEIKPKSDVKNEPEPTINGRG
jgi:hypothetical protein